MRLVMNTLGSLSLILMLAACGGGAGTPISKSLANQEAHPRVQTAGWAKLNLNEKLASLKAAGIAVIISIPSSGEVFIPYESAIEEKISKGNSDLQKSLGQEKDQIEAAKKSITRVLDILDLNRPALLEGVQEVKVFVGYDSYSVSKASLGKEKGLIKTVFLAPEVLRKDAPLSKVSDYLNSGLRDSLAMKTSLGAISTGIYSYVSLSGMIDRACISAFEVTLKEAQKSLKNNAVDYKNLFSLTVSAQPNKKLTKDSDTLAKMVVSCDITSKELVSRFHDVYKVRAELERLGRESGFKLDFILSSAKVYAEKAIWVMTHYAKEIAQVRADIPSVDFTFVVRPDDANPNYISTADSLWVNLAPSIKALEAGLDKNLGSYEQRKVIRLYALDNNRVGFIALPTELSANYLGQGLRGSYYQQDIVKMNRLYSDVKMGFFSAIGDLNAKYSKSIYVDLVLDPSFTTYKTADKVTCYNLDKFSCYVYFDLNELSSDEYLNARLQAFRSEVDRQLMPQGTH